MNPPTVNKEIIIYHNSNENSSKRRIIDCNYGLVFLKSVETIKNPFDRTPYGNDSDSI